MVSSDNPDFIDKVIAKVDAEEAELQMLRDFHNEVVAALANERAGDIEHLLATAMLGKHTTVIGRKRLEQLHHAERDAEYLRGLCSKQRDEIQALNDMADAVECLREIGNLVGCGHVDDPDGRRQLVNCVDHAINGEP